MCGVQWDDAIIGIYFVYGLAFYSLGLALLVESGRSSQLGFARSMRLLAGFGLLHGTHEWLDMAGEIHLRLCFHPLPEWLLWLRLSILITSFVALVAFGEHLLARESEQRAPTWKVTIGVLVFFVLSAVIAPLTYHLNDQEWRQVLDVLARYVIGIPGALLACLALEQQRQTFLKRDMRVFAQNLIWAILALFLYGFIGQSFPSHSKIFPSMFLNSDLFMDVFGFPVEMLRAGLASIVALSMIGVLRALEFESEQRLESIERQQIEAERRQAEEMGRLNAELMSANEQTQKLLAEVKKRDERRGELLQRITAAQESERQRIARELHDDTGQVLTGLGLGLRGLSTLVKTNPELAATRFSELEKMATSAIAGLRHLINDLRPPQLDDMGLVAALRFMRERMEDLKQVPIEVEVVGEPCELSTDVETALFRIAQESVTNAIKHANPGVIRITLNCRPGVVLCIEDDGNGFEPERVLNMEGERTAWGLYGVQERAKLINADFQIYSSPGEGTRLVVSMDEKALQESQQLMTEPM